MATLNQLVSNHKHKANRAYDRIFKNRVKFLYGTQRARFVKQHIEKHGQIYPDLIQDLGAIPLIKVDKSDPVCSDVGDVGCIILRTVEKIPKNVPIRESDPFYYVGGIDKNTPYSYTTPAFVKSESHNKFTGKVTRYAYYNGYIYIYAFDDFSKGMRFVNVAGIFEDPRAIAKFNKCEGATCYDDAEAEYPLPTNMLDLVMKGVDEALGGDISTNKEVEINAQ